MTPDPGPLHPSLPSAPSRRTLLQAGSLVLLLGTQQIARGATILAVRVWPAPEYSRVTIESDGQLTTKQFFVTTPPRLALDIEGIDLSPELRELVAKVKPDDPNIAGIRAGQNTPGVVRLVIDLKQAALPQVFTLPPVAAYRHRLVAIRGIGRWTAEMFLIFYLMRPNVLPLDDVGLINGISQNYFSGDPVSRSDAREVAEAWKPWCSVATWYIWRSLDPAPTAD